MLTCILTAAAALRGIYDQQFLTGQDPNLLALLVINSEPDRQ